MSSPEKDNYISLEEAMKYCEYSQEYLSLRARQGKLKAIKIGRNWVIKRFSVSILPPSVAVWQKY